MFFFLGGFFKRNKIVMDYFDGRNYRRKCFFVYFFFFFRVLGVVGWRKRMVGASALVERQPQTVGGRERSV